MNDVAGLETAEAPTSYRSLVNSQIDALPQEAIRMLEMVAPCHDQSHSVRVALVGAFIATAEMRDARLTVLAALLHDIGHASAADQHEVESARVAGNFLAQMGLPDPEIAEIRRAIESHRFTTGAVGTSEGIVAPLLDADRLDALGFIGISRAFLWLGEHGWPTGRTEVSWDMSNKWALERHWNEKLKHLPSRMMTPTGRRLAAKRVARMEGFIDQFRSETLDCDEPSAG